VLTAVLSLALALPTHGENQSSPIPWIDDDWEKAKNLAQKDKKLLAVDVWATWCHTCLSMKNYVFTSPKMSSIADQHVWLEMDYDRPKNAAFFKRYEISAFPSFMVIDPKTDQVVARWLGSGTTEEMIRFFKNASSNPKGVFEKGQIALSVQDYKNALKYFLEALKTTKNQRKRTRILSGYIEATRKTDNAKCATDGVKYIDQVDDTAQGLDFVMMVSYCAESLKEPQAMRAVLQRVKTRLEKALANPKLAVSPDDKSSVYATLISIYEQLKEDKQAQAAIGTRLRMLESAADAAPDAKARGTFDAHRMSCYLSLKQFAKAEKMLKRSEIDVPDDFNTPWRLALLYRKQNRFDDGLNAIARALKKGYGPRRIRLYSAKIDLAAAKQDYVLARKTVQEAQREIKGQDQALIRGYWLKELAAKEKLIPPK
jgi:tetratricopeptide (TPR) repeat protein